MTIARDYYLQKLIDRRENGRIKVITGIRRCGKSYLLFNIFGGYLRESGVSEEQIISLRLDELQNLQYRNPFELDKYVRERASDPKKQYFVLIDEIQEVRPVQNPWLDGAEDKVGFVEVLLGFLNMGRLDVYVTGSNSRMLSSDIMTEFRDRGDEIQVNPLTFKEYAAAFEGSADEAWEDFIIYGGLPRVLSEKTAGDKGRYLRELIRKTYLADVVERNKIKNDIGVLDDLLNFVASNVGSLTNPAKLENSFMSVKNMRISDTTISSYLDRFAEAFLIRKALQYDVKGRKYINTPVKYYFTDIGLRNAQLNFRQIEETHLMENLIFNELSARGYSVDIGVLDSYKKDSEGRTRRSRLEIDFVVNDINSRCYIQSAYAIPDEQKRLQETASLRKIDDNYAKIVVLGSKIKPRYDDYGIFYVGIQDFLLGMADEVGKGLRDFRLK